MIKKSKTHASKILEIKVNWAAPKYIYIFIFENLKIYF